MENIIASQHYPEQDRRKFPQTLCLFLLQQDKGTTDIFHHFFRDSGTKFDSYLVEEIPFHHQQICFQATIHMDILPTIGINKVNIDG